VQEGASMTSRSARFAGASQAGLRPRVARGRCGSGGMGRGAVAAAGLQSGYLLVAVGMRGRLDWCKDGVVARNPAFRNAAVGSFGLSWNVNRLWVCCIHSDG
jgi:hypothetical protein